MGELHVICPHRQAQRKQIFITDRKTDGQKKINFIGDGLWRELIGQFFFCWIQHAKISPNWFAQVQN